jgi:hypothetical protein
MPRIPRLFILVLLVSVVALGTSVLVSGAHASAQPPVAAITLGPAPLGDNVAPGYPAPSGTIDAYLKALGPITQRYGGGSYADSYDWQTDTDTYACGVAGQESENFTGPCAHSDPFSYAAYVADSKAIGSQPLIIINYGSGTPALAASWATQAVKYGYPNTVFEIGNEGFGCWEDNFPLTGAPVYDKDFEPNVPALCPMRTEGTPAGETTLAESYDAHVAAFAAAIKKADPKASIVVPYQTENEFLDGSDWNHTVLQSPERTDFNGILPSFYPSYFSGSVGVGSNPNDNRILGFLRTIPAVASVVKEEISAYDPGRYFAIGETGASSAETNIPCLPVGAVFAAGDTLYWLSEGAHSISAWEQVDTINANGCSADNSAMFSSNGTPHTTYWGYLLASKLAQPGAKLWVTDSDNGAVLAFRSDLKNGTEGEMYVNLDVTASEVVAAPALPSGRLISYQYSAGDQNASNSLIVTGAEPAGSLGKHVTLPPESVTVYQR